jgi:hypothetical protein
MNLSDAMVFPAGRLPPANRRTGYQSARAHPALRTALRARRTWHHPDIDELRAPDVSYGRTILQKKAPPMRGFLTS